MNPAKSRAGVHLLRETPGERFLVTAVMAQHSTSLCNGKAALLVTILQLEVPPNMQSLHCFPLSTEQTRRLPSPQRLFLSAPAVPASCNATSAEGFICVMYLKNTLILKYVVLVIRNGVN